MLDEHGNGTQPYRDDLPSVSLIVPTYQRPRQLTACLTALAALDYPHTRLEVIVVDDGSASPPHAIVASFAERLPVTLHTQRNAGPAAARNTGASRAEGPFLAFTDDDCAPAPDWLRWLVQRAAALPDHMLGGRAINALRANPYAAASQALVSYLYEYYNFGQGRPSFFTSNNILMPAAHFRAVGGFDTRYPRAAAEDREFCDRWLRHGLGMTYVPEAVIEHFHALTLRSFWRQHLNYGRGAYHFHQNRAQHNHDRVRVEPLRFYLDLVRYPLTAGNGWRSAPIAALLLVSQVANVAGYFVERAAGLRHRSVKAGVER